MPDGGARSATLERMNALSLRWAARGHLQASGVSPLSLPTFFAAAKKVGAAPHRGEANRPIRMQGKANALGKQPKQPGQQHAEPPISRTPCAIYWANRHPRSEQFLVK
jgi:hypothetical protein